jgi:hypothetical protein
MPLTRQLVLTSWEGQWLLTVAQGLDVGLSLPSIECELKLQDVYRKVAVPENAGIRP